MDIKNFEDFELDNTVNEESEDNQNLSDDIEVYKKDMDDDITKLDTKEWKITKIIDVIKDPKEIEDLEKQIHENTIGFKLTTDLDAKDIKRGDTVYMTAMLAPRNKSVAYSPGTIGVLKCRVQEIYLGLNKLKSLIK